MVERFQKKNRSIKKAEASPAEIKPTLIMIRLAVAPAWVTKRLLDQRASLFINLI